MLYRLNKPKTRRRISSVLLIIAALAALGGVSYADRVLNLGVTWGAGMAPIANTGTNDMGINTFLDREPDQAKVAQSLRMVAAGGFKYIRQIFPWYDIEIAAKGDFTDRRGPGAAHSAWDKYDFIVNTANSLGLEVLARVDGTPLWAGNGAAPLTGIGYFKGPPANNQDFADFMTTLATRYKGKVRYYQIWNEPNLAVEWAAPANASAYTSLLKVGYTAVKQADPVASVVMAGLAPTVGRVEQGGNQDELVYSQQMYDAGAKDYFDVASVMIYGLGFSPDTRFTDLRLPGDNKRVNFSRVELARAVMVKNNDSAKPLWASEYGWVSIPANWTGKPSSWGQSVDEQTQARYLVAGFERAQAEWPWMGPMFVWHLRDPDPPAGEPQQFFSILNQDFSPRPAYTALADYARRYPIADTGAYTLDSGAATFSDTGGVIKFQGNRLDLIYSTTGDITGTLDNNAVMSLALVQSAPGAVSARITVANNLPDSAHTFSFNYGANKPELTGFIVSRNQPMPWIFPLAEAVLGLTAFLGFLRLVWRR